jgi:hypothetical protein
VQKWFIYTSSSCLSALATSPDSFTEQWGDQTLSRTLQEYFGAGSDAGLPDELRFLVNVATLVERQIKRGAPPSAPAAFVLSPTPPATLASQLRQVPMLDNGLTDLAGQIWFVGPVFGIARGFQPEEWDDETVFALLGTPDIAKCPTIYVETRTPKPELRFYNHGSDEPNSFEVLTLPRDALDLADVYGAVDGVHNGCLITPNVLPAVRQLKLWQKPSQYWVSRQAEATIEHHLYIGLHAAFPTHRVDTQLDEPTGRLDIAIAKADWSQPGRVTNHVVLELKVLRSFGSTGRSYSSAKVKTIVSDGVVQAASYRDDRNSRLASLCCFDMRKSVTSTCFTAAKPLAKKKKVDIHSWRVFPTSGALRAARAKAHT